MEIMGLIVIVILITLVLFFVLAFDVNKAQNNAAPTAFSQDKLTGTLGTTLFETTTTCGRSVKELLEDCASYKEIQCGTEDSCTYVNNTIINITNRTLAISGIKYFINISSTEGKTTTFIESGCNPDKSKNLKTVPITSVSTGYGSTMRFQLTICT